MLLMPLIIMYQSPPFIQNILKWIYWIHIGALPAKLVTPLESHTAKQDRIIIEIAEFKTISIHPRFITLLFKVPLSFVLKGVTILGTISYTSYKSILPSENVSR